MNKLNYAKKLTELLNRMEADLPVGDRPLLFLHACCAPCSSYVLEYLSHYFRIIVYYYNPNITPQSEYRKRVDELKRFISDAGYENLVSFLEGPYDPADFDKIAKGYEDAPERGPRCYRCYELRMREAAREAVRHHADFFTTTLSISPHKNAEWINEIGQRLAQEYGVPHLPNDFKKNNGFKRSIELAAEYGLYRQNYCGCRFSKPSDR